MSSYIILHGELGHVRFGLSAAQTRLACRRLFHKTFHGEAPYAHLGVTHKYHPTVHVMVQKTNGFVTAETETDLFFHAKGVWTITLSSNRSRCSDKLLMLHCQPHQVTATGRMIDVDRWQCLSVAQH